MPSTSQRNIRFQQDNFWACSGPGTQVGTPGAANSYVRRDNFALWQFTTSDTTVYVQAVGQTGLTQLQGYVNGVLNGGAFLNFTNIGVNEQKALTLPAGAGKLVSLEAVCSITGLWTASGEPVNTIQSAPANTCTFAGDSLVMGFGAVPLADGFVTLNKWQASKFTLGTGVWNWGTSGQSLHDFQATPAALVTSLLARCTGTVSRRLVWQWGVNDWFKNGGAITTPQGLWSGASYGSFLGARIADVHAADPGIDHVWLQPFQNTGQGTANSAFGETMAQFIANATPFIPGYVTIWNGQTLSSVAQTVDGLHYSNAGNASIAANILPLMQ